MLTKSFVSGKIHYDFSNDLLNYSEFFEDVDKCGSIDQTRRCLDCQQVIKWNDYHVICNYGVTHSSNYTSMFYKKIYYEKWTVKETEDSVII